MQQLRNRSTRALWDPGYVDESWIGTAVQLIRKRSTNPILPELLSICHSVDGGSG
jgi:hypothetical protein